MHTKIKSLIATISLLSIMTIQAEALDSVPPNVELLGNADGIVYVPGDEPFLLAENMEPGDSVTRTLEIKNNYDKAYKLYLRAERVTPSEKYDLLDVINLKISYKDKVIYEGPVSGEDGMTNNIEIGTFQPGDEENLTATAQLDYSATDPAYLNKRVQVDWIFTAQAEEVVEDSIDPDEELTNPDEDLIDKDDDSIINPSINNKPNTISPQTGDSSMYAYTILGGASIVGLLYNLKRKNIKK